MPPRPSSWSLVCLAGGGLVLLFVLAPLAGMLLATSPADLWATARETAVAQSIWLTIWTSAAGTLLLAVPAIPCAWFLARRRFPGRGLILALIDLPVIIPHSAAGIALLTVLNRASWAGRAAESCGTAFVGTHWGIMAAMAFVSLPFLINAARDGFAAVPPRLEHAAQTLGASPLYAFLTVSLPLAWRAILSGLILMFARGLSEFGAVIVIAYHPMVTPVMVYERFTAFGLRHARPVAVVFILVCLLVFLVLRLLVRRDHARG
jgi:molybdate/tungstate transport system permease protein